MASPTIQTLTSFSGADLVATFANKVIGELQQISWAVQRDKAPVFTCGSPDARSFSRGKRGLAGSMVFAVFDHDALVTALQTVWHDIAPSAMFTAAANNKLAMSEDFANALDIMKWNEYNSNMALGQVVDDSDTPGVDETQGISQSNRTGYGFSFGRDKTSANVSDSEISAQIANGSNNNPTLKDGFPVGGEADVNGGEGWDNKGDKIYVPAGFAPIRGQNVIYADTLPPFDITLTFASEYGHTAFQKIYDVDILNESSGASVDTVVMARQVTWIARRMSPLIRGIYERDSNGLLRSVLPTDASSNSD